MPNLLRANVSRLQKDRVFWLLAAGMVILGGFLPVSSYLNARVAAWYEKLENGFFAGVIPMALVMAAFTALFIGTDYSDGTLRNKLIAGHRRGQIYLANLIVCLLAGALLLAGHLLVYFCVGAPLLGMFTCGAEKVLGYALASLMTVAAFTALFVLVAQLCRNRAYAAVMCLLLAVVLLFAGVWVVARLDEPEMSPPAYEYTGGTFVQHAEEPNPRYLRGAARDICEFLRDFLPGAQAVQITNMDAVHLGRMMLYDLAILLGAAVTGMARFRKKDLM